MLGGNAWNICGSSSVDRASAFQAEGRGFEPRLPLYFMNCLCSSVVEHFLGKEEVPGSNPGIGSREYEGQGAWSGEAESDM